VDGDTTWRRVVEDDVPLLGRRPAEPRVARWWNHETSPEAVRRDSGPTARGEEPAEDLVALLDGRPFGLAQRSRIADHPDELAACPVPPNGDRPGRVRDDAAVTDFHALHVPGRPFVLPNAWDVGSARLLAAAGAPAVGTTSLGVAASAGVPDGFRAARGALVVATRAVAACGLPCPVSADLQDGFSDDPGEVAALVASLPVAGVNLEDSTDGRLRDPDVLARTVAAVRAAAPGVFVNARTDVFWLGGHDADDARARVRRYADAGADGVFVPGVTDLALVESLVHDAGVPLNVLASPARTLQDWARAGVARVSTGSLLYRAALAAARELAGAAASSAPADGPTLTYAQVQALHGEARPG
jgi:2-methylisocitrate lyase-like PEP mutase family enzyme